MPYSFRFRPTIVTLLVALMMGLGLSAGAQPAQAQSSACPAGAVTVRPQDNVQSIVDRNAEGAVFCFQAGTYGLVSINPKDRQQFIGVDRDTVIWDGQNSRLVAISGTRDPIGDDPNDVIGIVLANLTIRNYAGEQPTSGNDFWWWNAAVNGNVGWTIRNVVFRDNNIALAFGNQNHNCSNDVLMEDTSFINNRNGAFYWNGVRATFRRILMLNNGWSSTDEQVYWSGSQKVTNQGVNAPGGGYPCVRVNSDRIIADQIQSYGNKGVGWWNDINVTGFEMTNSTIAWNRLTGFMHEISYSANVSRSRFYCNNFGYDNDTEWRGGDVFIVSSRDVTIDGNLIAPCASGDTVTISGYTYRWSAREGGRGLNLFEEERDPVLGNLIVQNNTFELRNGASWALQVGRWGNGSVSNLNLRNNRYSVAASGQTRWVNYGDRLNFGTWQSRGYDGGSNEVVASLVLQPAPTLIAPTRPSGGVTGTPTVSAPTATPTVSAPTAAPTATTPPTQAAALPYLGAPATVPGRIQAENFDLGGQNISYYDLTQNNEGPSTYRIDGASVDLKPNTAGDQTIGWFQTDEWVQYTVNVPQAGAYNIVLSVGTVDPNRTVALSVDGQNVATNVAVPTIPNWDAPLGVVSVPNVQLGAGTRKIRIQNTSGYLDFDYFEIAQASAPTPTTVAQVPTNTPVPVVPTPTPSTAGLRAVPNLASFTAGAQVQIAFNLEQPALLAGGVRALEAACTISPVGIIAPQAVVVGSTFAPNPVSVNPGVRPDGTFTFAVAQSGTNAPVTTAGTVFTLNATALLAGSAQVTCNTTIIDANRVEQPLPFAGGAVVVAAPTTVVQLPTATALVPTATVFVPTATTVPPTATLVPPTATTVVTIVPTNTAAPTATATVTPTTAPSNGSIVGNVTSSATRTGGITVNLLLNGAVVATTVSATDGSFTLANIPPGTYTIRAEAQGHLPAEGPVTVTAGQAATKQPLVLPAGDIVQSGTPVIDELDVVQLAVNYGIAAATSRVEDLDRNGRVGLGDLTSLSENLRAAGPIAWN